MKRQIKSQALGPVNTNCYTLIDEDTKQAIVVDPGDKPETFIQSFKDQGLNLCGILLTHGHFDHIGGVAALVHEYHIPVYAMEAERPLLGDGALNLSSRMRPLIELKEFQGLKDGETIDLAGFHIQAIHTPGHTAGGGCYYIAQESIIFTGDTLFAGCIGRTDFPTGETATLVRSVREKLLTLPEDTIVYPGHMDATTIGHEKLHNPMV